MDPVQQWHALLFEAGERTPAFCSRFAESMRAGRLTFGERVHCPFLRPFFLSTDDERRIAPAAETIARAGERVVRAALESPELVRQLGVSDDELELIGIDPGYATASTASRLDAFLLPESLHFAEYNAESPAGPGYTERLAEMFDALDTMARFRKTRRVHFHRPVTALLDALIASYKEWGGSASPPVIAIVDWREVPTWSEFEILRDAFVAAGVTTIVCDPRELSFDGRSLDGGGRRIDLVYRRVLMSDIVARRHECAALVRAYAARAVCVANTFRCKLAHKKAFFSVLTDPKHARLFSDAERAVFRAHVPWTRLVDDTSTDVDGSVVDLVEYVRRNRETLVLKPNDEYGGKGVLLGWEAAERSWDEALQAAVNDHPGTWVVQRRIPVRREVFPQFDGHGEVTMREMLVDFAPYLFRGRMAGYLTRLSATGLANVTSGGGQVPSFVVGEAEAT
jgi:uncharacterized circularly permuted ATP-grasp superfamily protein